MCADLPHLWVNEVTSLLSIRLNKFSRIWKKKKVVKYGPRNFPDFPSNLGKPKHRASRTLSSVQFSSVAQSYLTLWPHKSQYSRFPCSSPTPRVYPNSCPSSWWCHPVISSSVIPFSSCLQSFPSGSFQMSQLFASGSQNTGVSASTSVPPMNI